jgi:hypothetical protein
MTESRFKEQNEYTEDDLVNAEYSHLFLELSRMFIALEQLHFIRNDETYQKVLAKISATLKKLTFLIEGAESLICMAENKSAEELQRASECSSEWIELQLKNSNVVLDTFQEFLSFGIGEDETTNKEDYFLYYFGADASFSIPLAEIVQIQRKTVFLPEDSSENIVIKNEVIWKDDKYFQQT